MQRILGAFFILTAIVIGGHTIVEPLYYTSVEGALDSPLWGYLNWLTGLAVFFGWIFSLMRKQGFDTDTQPVTRDFAEANAQFYGFTIVAILFYRNWFAVLMDGYNAYGPDAAHIAWFAIDAGVAVLCGSLGMHMWQSDSSIET